MTRLRGTWWRQPWLWLGVTFVVAAVTGIHYALKLRGYYIMPDELTYQREAIAIGDRLRPLLPGDGYYNSPGELSPMVQAIVWRIVGPVGTAIDASHVVNVLVFASACVPIYLLTRRITGSVVASLLAGAATVAVPWAAMTATLMTEPIAYTAFCWAVLLIQRSVAEPGTRGDVIGLLGVGLALLGRSQLAVLAGTLLVALLVREGVAARTEGVRVVLRRHVVLIGVGALVVLYLLVTGASPRGALGNYGIAAEGDVLPAGAFAYARELLTSVGLAAGVLTLPLAAGWAFAALGRPRREQPFAGALVVIVTVALLAVVVGAYSVRFTAGQNDRYIAYVAPLLFVGTAAAFTVGPFNVLAMAIAGLGSAWLYWTATLALLGPSLVAPGSSFRGVLYGRPRVLAAHLGINDADPTAVIAVLLVIVLAVIVIATRRLSLALVGAAVGVAVLAYGMAETNYTLNKVAPAQISHSFVSARGWADRALPPGQHMNAFIGVTSDQAASVGIWWDGVFYNRRVKRVYEMVNEPSYDQPAPLTVDMDPRTGVMSGLPGGYLLVPNAPVRVGLRDLHPIATNGVISLVRAPARPRAAFSFDAFNGSGAMNTGTRVPLRVFGDGRARKRSVTVTVVARGGDVRLAVSDEHGRRLAARTLRRDIPVPLKLTLPVRAAGPSRVVLRLDTVRHGAISGAYMQALGIALGP